MTEGGNLYKPSDGANTMTSMDTQSSTARSFSGILRAIGHTLRDLKQVPKISTDSEKMIAASHTHLSSMNPYDLFLLIAWFLSVKTVRLLYIQPVG